jgi:hypothetical protein
MQLNKISSIPLINLAYRQFLIKHKKLTLLINFRVNHVVKTGKLDLTFGASRFRPSGSDCSGGDDMAVWLFDLHMKKHFRER